MAQKRMNPKYHLIIISSIFLLLGLPILIFGFFALFCRQYTLAVWALFMGFIFSLVGGSNLYSAIKRNAHKNSLSDNGIHILATVDDISVDTSLTINGECPFVIYCSYEDPYTQKSYEFVSDQFWDCPDEAFPLGSTIDVLVNPNDYSIYHVNAEEKMDQWFLH